MTAMALAGWLLTLGASLGLVARQRRTRVVGRLDVQRACHELRGPITAARLGLQLGARTGQLSAASLRALDLELGRAGLALDDLSSPASGYRHAAPVDVGGLLEVSVLAWRASAEMHGAQLVLRWAGTPAWVQGDRLRLAQVTGNLIANAIEHGGGTITVTGELQGTVVRIEVRDDGPGLPASVARTLTRDARRRRGARRPGRPVRALRRSPSGRPRPEDAMHGHGLAIAERIVTQHHGRIYAEPCERGARVVSELPILSPLSGASSPRRFVAAV